MGLAELEEGLELEAAATVHSAAAQSEAVAAAAGSGAIGKAVAAIWQMRPAAVSTTRGAADLTAAWLPGADAM